MIIQGTPEWLQLRAGKVTASRVADILAKTKTGVSASRANYLIELAIQRVTGTVEESFKNDAMAWGTEQEPFARMKYEVAKSVLVDEVPFIDHPTIKWFGCSPDGLVGDDGLVEIKAPNSKTHWEYFKAGEAPGKYVIQMQTQMACTGRAWCDFISYDPRMPEGSQMLIKRYARDDKLIGDIESAVKKFLEEVDKEVQLMRNN
jgi:putative phage-type endonuclease